MTSNDPEQSCPLCPCLRERRTSYSHMPTPYDIHENAKAHGWYDGVDGFHQLPPDFIPSKLALIHAEISEALEAYRTKGCDTRGTSRPGEHGLCEELADAVLRIFDLAEFLGLDIIGMIAAKHAYNRSRPHKHGGKLV